MTSYFHKVGKLEARILREPCLAMAGWPWLELTRFVINPTLLQSVTWCDDGP